MAKAGTATRKGDMIEFNGGDFRLERVVLVAEGVRREAADDDGTSTYKLYRKVDTNGVLKDADGIDQPTSYTYRYDVMAEFTAADDDAATTEAKSLISGS